MVFEHRSEQVLPGYRLAMVLGGMGPVDTKLSPLGKAFAGAHALYAGLVFVVAAGVLLAPVVHRILHTVHCDLD